MPDEIIYENEEKNNKKGEDVDWQEEDVEMAVDHKIKNIKEKLKECQKAKEENLAGWQRSQADLINYKKRQEEQMKEWQKLINEKLIMDLLPVLDSLEKAPASEGIDLVKKQFQSVLKNHGLEEIKSLGEKFNPEFHEAIAMEENGENSEVVSEEFQKGYTLNGKVIRTAKVKIYK